MRAAPIKTSFNAGELSPRLDARTDIAKYATGLKVSQNLIPLAQGPVTKRAGTRYVASVKSPTLQTWLAKFEFNFQQSFVLEFGAGYIRFYYNHGLLLATASAWSGATAYTVGQCATSGGVTYYCILAHTNHVPPNATYWYPLTDGIYEVPAPWYASSFLINNDGTFSLSMVQSGDVIYIAGGGGFPPQKLSRISNSQWTIAEVDFVGGPFGDQNTDESLTMYASAQTGAVTITVSTANVFSIFYTGLLYIQQNTADDTEPWEANKAIIIGDLRTNDGKNYKAATAGTTGYVSPIHTVGFQYDGDGGIQWEYQDPGYGIVNITSVSLDTLTLTGTVIDPLPIGAVGVANGTWVWAKSAWGSNEVGGEPDYVTFFRQRLVFARGQSVWFSVTGDYEDFAAKEFGEIVDDSAISLDIQGDDTSEVLDLISTKQGLIVTTSGGQTIISESTTQSPFSPSNIKVYDGSGYGGRPIHAVRINDYVVYVQRAGRKIRESVYDFDIDNFVANDISLLSEHITGDGITTMAYQRDPYNIIWMTRADGQLVGLTYDKSQDVAAWHRHIIGGSYGSGNAIVESIAVIPNPDGTRDDLWMIVKRTINGATVRYVEYMEKEYETGDDQDSCFYVDSGLTYDGAAATTITGLDHLEGAVVAILADGGSHPPKVVTGGEITLERSASVVQVGLPYLPLMQTLKLEAGSQDGTAQGKIKRINSITVRMLNSQSVLIGGNGTQFDKLVYRVPSTPMGTPEPIFTGDKEITWNQGYDINGYIYVTQEYPFPMTILALIPNSVTYDKG